MSRVTNAYNDRLSSPKYRESRNFEENYDENAENFGKTLADFGYEFNEEGELRHLTTKERFNFEIRPGDRAYNQRHYEALGDVITDEIYRLLEKQCGLKRIKIPIDAARREPAGFFFASPDYQTNDRLLILIHGSGAVRAGQWARRLIINDNLKTGTQLPYVEKAKSAGFAVVVLNTNQNKLFDEKGVDHYIRDNEDPLSHCLHIWDHFILPSKAKHIAIVAHSAGGYVTVKLATERSKEFVQKVFAVAFTDSAHASSSKNSAGWNHLLEVGQNWVTSRHPLDTDMQQYRNEIRRVSAGTTSHEETSSKAIDSVCAYIKAKLVEAMKEPVKSMEEQTDDAQVDEKKEAAIDIAQIVNGSESAVETVENYEQAKEDRQASPEKEKDSNEISGQNSVEEINNEKETEEIDNQQQNGFGNEIKKKRYSGGDDDEETEPKVKREKIEL